MGDAELKGKNPGREREDTEVIHGDLYAEWPGGRMTVHLDVFFPASAAEIRKLLKIIGLDIRHRDKLIRHMLIYLKDMIRRVGVDKSAAEAEAALCQQKYVEFQERAASKKHPSGIPLTVEELKTARASRDFYKREASSWDRDCKQVIRRIDRLDKNMELVRKLTGRN